MPSPGADSIIERMRLIAEAEAEITADGERQPMVLPVVAGFDGHEAPEVLVLIPDIGSTHEDRVERVAIAGALVVAKRCEQVVIGMDTFRSSYTPEEWEAMDGDFPLPGEDPKAQEVLLVVDVSRGDTYPNELRMLPYSRDDGKLRWQPEETTDAVESPFWNLARKLVDPEVQARFTGTFEEARALVEGPDFFVLERGQEIG